MKCVTSWPQMISKFWSHLHTYLFAMQFLVGLTLFCTQVVLFSIRITTFVSDNEDFVLSLAIYVYYCIANKFGTTSMQAEKQPLLQG